MRQFMVYFEFFKKPIMNAVMHCHISRRRWGGCEQDYYLIHDFIDSTKELCSDARHRIFHTHWGIQHLVIPIFGHTLINSEGKAVDVKDMCERDHLLVDYANQFIPTLSDFTRTINSKEIPDFKQRLENFHADFVDDPKISELMLSPLAATGQLKSLLLTHNSWFIHRIIPKIFDTPPVIKEFDLAPSLFFNAMKFEAWMDNGLSFPPSAKHLQKLKVHPS